ncbi:MAG: ABC transporter permease [Chloroflexota bacterium]|nr:ABC transporter permease [Chloroflexota bacterium]MEC9322187.1 ABC transporter permease [Chloroflexota bacterium]
MIAETYRGIWVVAFRELLHFISDRTRIISSLMFPLMFLVVFGAGFSRIVGGLAGGVDFIHFVYPGIVAMTVLTSSLLSGTSVVVDREHGFLKEVLVAPLSRVGIILGKALGGSLTSLSQGIVMLAIAPMIGLSITPLLIVKLLPTLLILSLSLSGLGILMATRMHSQQGFQFLMQLIVFPLMFLAGVFFPVDGVPVWLQVVAKVNPLTYGVDAIRQIFLAPLISNTTAEIPVGEVISTGITLSGHRMGVAEDVLVIGLIGSVFLLAGVWSFSRTEA